MPSCRGEWRARRRRRRQWPEELQTQSGERRGDRSKARLRTRLSPSTRGAAGPESSPCSPTHATLSVRLRDQESASRAGFLSEWANSVIERAEKSPKRGTRAERVVAEAPAV